LREGFLGTAAPFYADLVLLLELAMALSLLEAGTTLMPEKFRLTRFKLWMRAVLTAWWAVLFLGVATYARWYVPNLF
jgi:hypothetical protein